MITLEAFQNLAVQEVAQLVRAAGPKTCVFPLNGTRRWFALTHPPQTNEQAASAYLDAIVKRYIEIFAMIFDHGIDTLLSPIFGPDLTERGNSFSQMAFEGLEWPMTHPAFLDFYRSCQVCVRFYGDYRKFFEATPYVHLPALFDQATAQTLAYKQHRLFLGVCAHNDVAEVIAELAVRYYQEHNCVPNKHTLVEMYYGEYVEPVDIFIGFDKFCTFDMPLIASGNEDLYFTVSPSPYLTQRQLRDILYDHLYTRQSGEDPDYATLTSQDWALMREFYQANLNKTLGVGARQEHGDYWYPLPQVELPANFRNMTQAN